MQVKELLGAFGPLRALHLVRDAGATASKGVSDMPPIPILVKCSLMEKLATAFLTVVPLPLGYAFCEYMDDKITKIACEGLNGMALGDRTLTVRKAMTTGRLKIALCAEYVSPLP